MQPEQVQTILKNTAASLNPHGDWYVTAMERLVVVVQELSHARTLDAVMQIVRRAGRELTGADGATFVLRDGDNCYYAEENAISPLWKGRRFPMSACISGWVMLNAKPAVIPDIYKDPRIPVEAYRPTFVKSLAMVPIRVENPVGAIGNYWATNRQPTDEEVAILQALANVTSVSLENVDLYERLQMKLKALEESNYELARFAWSASHDLKSPLRAIDDLTFWIEDDKANTLSNQSKDYLTSMRRRVKRMEKLLDDVLDFSTVEKKMKKDDSGDMITGADVVSECENLVYLPPNFTVIATPAMAGIRLPRMPLLRIFCNLVDNAVKHHDKHAGHIVLDVAETDKEFIFTVSDDGPGIPEQYRARIFDMFQTLKPHDTMEGSGMGLAIVKKMLNLYDCDITAGVGETGGSRFSFNWKKKTDADRNLRGGLGGRNALN